VRHPHATYFLTLAEAAEARTYRADAVTWMAPLQSEQDNFRSALQWTLDVGRTGLAVRLGGDTVLLGGSAATCARGVHGMPERSRPALTR